MTFTAGSSNVLSFVSMDASTSSWGPAIADVSIAGARHSRTGHMGDDDPRPRGLGHGRPSEDPTADINNGRLS